MGDGHFIIRGDGHKAGWYIKGGLIPLCELWFPLHLWKPCSKTTYYIINDLTERVNNNIITSNYLFTGKQSLRSMDSYTLLKNKKIHQNTLISWHLNEILRRIPRAITQKHNFLNPWTISLTREIHPSTFYEIFRTIRDDGFEDFVECCVVRDKKSKIISYKMTFKSLGIVKHHLKKMCERDDIHNFFTKKFRDQSVGSLHVSEDSPALLSYKLKTNKCNLTSTYQIKSIYGTVITD